MKLSARNQFSGTVKAIEVGAVNDEVVVAIGDETLTATLTKDAVTSLGLAAGAPVTALFKASAVILGAGAPGKLSARNVFAGSVSAIKEGAVNAEVTLTTPAGLTVTAILTEDAIKDLGLAAGSPAYALVKATSIIIAA
ncbi:TOBE domain-containing protein [Plasticicumulans acidivorans]|uniref:Molybdate transport system regulatory protein n=1 Tax=Plasticicumulans acidivorans TaxID=886464 RepID=A0A317MZB3_9GAMM|nr:TOBE domain-containing protein [Plasticicumulans acidivorans]PWV65547.1 molybdate transport system regulatory protein [Plasticicumulans acidivorans]